MIGIVFNSLRGAVPLIRLQPFVAPQDRAKERHRLILFSSMTSAVAKLITAATLLITVPLTLHFLGPERYGMWVTMSSFLVMLSFADLGIGNGLLNAVATAYGRDDLREICRYVSSGFFALSVIAASILIVFAVAYRHVSWFAIFNVQSDLARREAGPALAIVAAGVALGVPASIVQRVQIGMQRGYMANLWQCVASVLTLVGIVIAIQLQAGLPWLVLIFVGAPLLVSALNTFTFFYRLHPEIAPSLREVSRDAVARVAHTGSLFLGLQIAGAVILWSNSLFIARFLGAEAVTQYAVPERMFDLITLITAMVLTPLWPAYGEARARGDHAWVKRTLIRSLIMGVGFAAILATALFFSGPFVIKLWVGNAVTPSVLLLLGLAVWKTIETGGIAGAMLQNSHDMLWFQLITASLVAISVVPLRMVLIPTMGVPGVVWATIISYTAFSILPTFIFFRRWWKL